MLLEQVRHGHGEFIMPSHKESSYVGTAASAPSASVNTQYASFLRRFSASFVDSLLLVLIFYLGSIALFGSDAELDELKGKGDLFVIVLKLLFVLAMFGVIVPWLYYAFMESSEYQATLGKRLLAIRVANQFGQRISFGCATGRFFAKIFLSSIVFVGYFMALFTERNQALHDKLAGTYVLYLGGR